MFSQFIKSKHNRVKAACHSRPFVSYRPCISKDPGDRWQLTTGARIRTSGQCWYQLIVKWQISQLYEKINDIRGRESEKPHLSIWTLNLTTIEIGQLCNQSRSVPVPAETVAQDSPSQMRRNVIMITDYARSGHSLTRSSTQQKQKERKGTRGKRKHNGTLTLHYWDWERRDTKRLMTSLFPFSSPICAGTLPVVSRIRSVMFGVSVLACGLGLSLGLWLLSVLLNWA